jgi:hypothetical protein
MQITVEVPDNLVSKLRQFDNRLSEVLERGIQELQNDQLANFQDEAEIIELLASQPTPEEILTIRPTLALQERMSTLLAQSKAGNLTRQEEIELERYLALEHLVRLAKASAYKQLRKQA